MDRVDQRTAEAGTGLGQRVDGLDHPGVCGGVETIEPLSDLVRDVDLPFTEVHPRSIALGIRPRGHQIRQAALGGLIRDLHTSISAGRDVAELLDLAVLLRSHATAGWLRVVEGSLDLRSQATELARRAAIERETPQALGPAAWGDMYVLVLAGLSTSRMASRTRSPYPLPPRNRLSWPHPSRA